MGLPNPFRMEKMRSRNLDRKVQSLCMIPLTDKGLGLNVCVVPPVTYVPLILDGEIRLLRQSEKGGVN